MVSLKYVKNSLIFFERKDRLYESLCLAYEVVGDSKVVLCKELSKAHESILRFNLSELERLPALLGELTVILSKSEARYRTSLDKVCSLISSLNRSLPVSSLVSIVSEFVVGYSKKEIYTLVHKHLVQG